MTTKHINSNLGNGDELQAMIDRAMAAFNSLSPEEQRAHRRDQAISFAHGQMLMSRFEKGKPDLTPEEEQRQKQMIADIYDRRQAKKKDLSEP